ncbi:Unknown protein [Striga hermonthica]|uniref:Uncharacterized protein n=1 Tax=Striga hermonthica TaxID=68872 RepID=A0A9N7NB86_STRHE|nr:Unknown protein [Striga hermonthica]
MVLKTPDFRNCKAASEIREGMKLLVDHYKDMISEAIKIEALNNIPIHPPPSIPNGPKPAVSSAQNGTPIQLSGHKAQGTYIVGGSAFGWNFITFNSNRAAYYGRTKEDFRAANVKPPEVRSTDS